MTASSRQGRLFVVEPTPADSWCKWPFSGPQNPPDKKPSFVHEERSIPSPCFCGRSRTGQQPCSVFFSSELVLKATRDRLKGKSAATAPSPSTRKEASNAHLVGSTRTSHAHPLQTVPKWCLTGPASPAHQKLQHLRSTPTPTTPKPTLNILQLNCNGIGGKTPEIAAYLNAHDIKLAAIQETKLTAKSRDPNFGSYTVLRQDRPANREGGGLAFLIHEDIVYTPMQLPQDGTMECMGNKVDHNNTSFRVINYYIPPTSSCPEGYSASTEPLLKTDNTLVLGDANAHDPLWHSPLVDTRGNKLAGEIEFSDYGVLNENTPTRIPSNNQPTSPDVSLASMSLLTSAEWSTETSLSSDHLPITIKLAMSSATTPVRSVKKTYTNLAKADWEAFSAEVETIIHSSRSINCPDKALIGAPGVSCRSQTRGGGWDWANPRSWMCTLANAS